MSATSQEKSAVVAADPRPAAAYLLGGHSRMAKRWFDQCTHWCRDFLGSQPALIYNLNELDTAVLHLRDEIEAAVYDDLRAAIRAVKDHAVEFDYQRGVQKCYVLCSEANRALPPFNPLFGWYALGRVVGSYWKTFENIDEGEQLPEFRTLQDQVRERLEIGGEGIPIPQALVVLGETFVKRPVYAIHQVLEKGDFYEREEGSAGIAGMLVYELHHLIHEQLRKLTRSDEEVKETPIWDDKQSALFWRGKVIREYKRDPAENQVELIEAFHRAGWPPSVLDPFAGLRSTSPKTLSNTIYELNRTLVKDTIRFSGDGTGEGARWEPVRKRR